MVEQTAVSRPCGSRRPAGPCRTAGRARGRESRGAPLRDDDRRRIVLGQWVTWKPSPAGRVGGQAPASPQNPRPTLPQGEGRRQPNAAGVADRRVEPTHPIPLEPVQRDRQRLRPREPDDPPGGGARGGWRWRRSCPMGRARPCDPGIGLSAACRAAAGCGCDRAARGSGRSGAAVVADRPLVRGLLQQRLELLRQPAVDAAGRLLRREQGRGLAIRRPSPPASTFFEPVSFGSSSRSPIDQRLLVMK